jgi:hypothetical protein
MKSKKNLPLFALSCLLVWNTAASCQSGNSGSSTYVGSTPCSAGTRPLPGIPKEAGCELIKWKLTLSAPAGGTYSLDCYYGLPKQGTQGLINGGTRLRRTGRWVNRTGMPGNPNAVICQLDPDTSLVSISFLRVNSNLLHLLDTKQHLLIGTGAWSYTLNKTAP